MEEARTVKMEALRDQFAPGGGFIFGPSGAKEGGTFMVTESEAKNYAEKAPHLARRLGPVHVPPGEVAADRTWADAGITLSPEEYLRRFPVGPDAALARAELAKAGTVMPETTATVKPTAPTPLPAPQSAASHPVTAEPPKDQALKNGGGVDPKTSGKVK